MHATARATDSTPQTSARLVASGFRSSVILSMGQILLSWFSARIAPRRPQLPRPKVRDFTRKDRMHRPASDRRKRMYLVRDVFQCKPGKSAELAARFKKTIPSMETEDRFRNCRVMVDAVADYWTVVLEAEFNSLSDFEHHMAEYSARADVRE